MMNQESRNLLALDIGERRIGVAIASDIARMPSPLKTIDTTETADVFGHIAKIVEENSCYVVVAGLPRNLNGDDTLQTKYARDFAKKLAEKIEVPVVMQDEAGTSVEAEQRLINRKKPYSKADIDAESAVILLTDYLREEDKIA